MPELPEVHTIASDLNKHISGKIIKKVVVSKSYNIKPGASEFVEKVSGKRIKGVRRIAKNIVIDLETAGHIIIHLAMTGRVLLRDVKDRKDNWIKAVFILDEGISNTQQVVYTDMRAFGKLVYTEEENLHSLVTKYGPEPLDKNLSSQEFLKQLQIKKTSIKNALLDQSLVAGLGNIYATDALFMAKILPERSTREITLREAEKLLEASREILAEGIKNRGSTLPDKMYVDIFGNEGSQQKHFKIYLKNICPVCNTKVSFKKIGGRGTYFCTNCQK